MSSFLNTGTLSLAGAVLAALALFLFGRRSGLKSGANALAKEKAKTREEETKTKVAQSVSDASTQTAKEQGVIQGQYQSVNSRVNDARRVGDIDEALRLASEMAQKALNKGAIEK